MLSQVMQNRVVITLTVSKHISNDPLHGITLKELVTYLMEKYGWDELGRNVNLKCFTNNPSLNSSLKFLRKTPWAREKVEAFYLKSIWLDSHKKPDSTSE